MTDGPGSSVGIANGYGLDDPGIDSRWGRVFPHLPRPALGPTQPPVQWVPGFSRGVKSGRGVTLTPHHLLVPWSWKGRAIPLLLLWTVGPVQSLSACTRVHFTIFIFWMTLYKYFISGHRILLLFVFIAGDTSGRNSGLGIAISQKKGALNPSQYVSSKGSNLSVKSLSPNIRISFLGK